jgi:Tfp pilus assembly protein PilE
MTLMESLTVVVVVVVIAAVSIPMWRIHRLRVQREDAMDALLAVQTAQDRHFGAQARYADNAGLGVKPTSRLGFYEIEVRRAADGLGYVAVARIAQGKGREDARCAELRLDEHGRRFAVTDAGEDSTADCWNRF